MKSELKVFIDECAEKKNDDEREKYHQHFDAKHSLSVVINFLCLLHFMDLIITVAAVNVHLHIMLCYFRNTDLVVPSFPVQVGESDEIVTSHPVSHSPVVKQFISI